MSEKLKKGLILILSAIVIVFLAVFVGDFLTNDFIKLVEKVNSSSFLKPFVLGVFALIVAIEIFKHFKKK